MKVCPHCGKEHEGAYTICDKCRNNFYKKMDELYYEGKDREVIRMEKKETNKLLDVNVFKILAIKDAASFNVFLIAFIGFASLIIVFGMCVKFGIDSGIISSIVETLKAVLLVVVGYFVGRR